MRFKHSKESKKKKVIKRLFSIFLTIFFVSVISVGGYVFWVIDNAEEIDPANIYEEINKNSYVYDSDGDLISTLHYSEDREIVSIDSMPANLKNAFIAIEDKTFYKHHGINYKRILGAIWSYLKGEGDISGTSTITQQLARNVYLSERMTERSINRKLVEAYYAIKIEEALTKNQILEAYLNAIYLGYGSYGVETAAETYFSKDVSELNLTECAALAALPQAPDSYALISEDGEDKIYGTNLYINDISKDRRELVLDLMASQGYISQKDANKAKLKLSEFIDPDLSKRDSRYSYFVDYVTDLLIRDFIKQGKSITTAEKLVYTGGLEIHTTLDSEIQDIIYNEFLEDSNFPWSEEEPQGAMVVTEVGTGKIRAMVGGRKASGERLFNRATSPRQPGSSIKPLSVYGAALQKSFEYEAKSETFPFTNFGTDKQGISGWGSYITASSLVRDEKMYFNGQIWPYNFSRSFTGRQTFRTALYQSLNTCAVKIQRQVGTEYSIETLKNFGISTIKEGGEVNDENAAALALGAMTEGVTPLEMASAYAVFPNSGIRNTPIFYTEVKDKDGKVILEGKTQEKKVLDSGVAFIMTDILKGVVSRGIAGNAYISGTSVGGKTGTTDDSYDMWFCGFTPKYSAALWIGTDHNNYMSGQSSQAAALWSRIMSQIPDVTEGEYPSQPNNVIYKGEYYTEGTDGNYTYMPNQRSRTNDSRANNSGGDMFEKIENDPV